MRSAPRTDGIARDIRLSFLSDPSSNTLGADVVIADVGGEDGWQEPQWGWSFQRCELAAPCHPSI